MPEQDFSKITDHLSQGADALDVIEFYVGMQCYGVSVLQAREIVRSSIGIIPVSDADPSIAGVVNLRGRILPVINLGKHFGEEIDIDDKESRIIILEDRQSRVGFLVNRVTRIQRILLSDINPPSDLVQSREKYTIGIVKIEDRVLFLMDFQRISRDICSTRDGQTLAEDSLEVAPVDFDRTTKKIIIAEDSPFIRNLIVGEVKKVGYKVVVVNNGFEAWQILEGTTQLPDFTDIADYYHLLIVDIEMPHMDGLHLIKNVRKHDALKKLPCIVFSSLITPEIAKKCKEVGSDGEISKPEIGRLISFVDHRVTK